MTISDNKMPIRVEDIENSDKEFPITPGSNEEEVLEFLTINSEYAYRPVELVEETSVPEGSINKTLRRLEDKGLVKSSNSAYYVDPELRDWISDRLAATHSLKVLSDKQYDGSEKEKSEENSSPESEDSEEVEEVFEEMDLE